MTEIHGRISIADKTQYLMKSRDRKIGNLSYHVALNFDKRLGSTTPDELVKFQSDTIIAIPKLATLWLHES